jgi:hypothetical protein
MTDAVEIFMGELKCKLQLFHPGPHDVFILTVPGELSFEAEERLISGFAKHFPETKMAVVIGPASVDLVEEVKN